ncbi:MAG TPA: DUF2339 domain-containing protein [Chryseosolibacter sp.]
MEDKNQAIRELHEKIEEIARKQKSFQEDIARLQTQIFELDLSERPAKKAQPVVAEQAPKVEPKVPPTIETIPAKEVVPVFSAPAEKPREPLVPKTKKEKTPIEEFIGTNLLNKIGIAILVIGIGFGVKYSIDHDLIQPLTRIILGYLAGIALIVLALRLKKNHANFSAVLLSGGMAVLYFITFAAYDFYTLIPQTMAFVLMVVFTAFTVFAAIQYNIEVIGIIGLVGAYAVPFLLSDGSGRVVILFSYMTIINAGILTLAFKKYWKRLYYLAFVLTWLAFGAWWVDQFSVEKHLTISLSFATVFFITFYITFLAYKLIRKEALSKLDLAFMLANSFLFYGFGYFTIEQIEGGDELLGLFTVATAMVHFIACVIIYKQQSHFRDIFYFVAGMVLVFLTLAVPVQLEGNWVTLVWAMEALLLFWIGRTKQFPVYEKLSYPLIALAAGSLAHDWDEFYSAYLPFASDEISPIPLFLNIQFFTTVAVCAALGATLFVATRTKFTSPFTSTSANNILIYGLGLTLLVLLYFGIYVEVQNYWDQRYWGSAVLRTNEFGDRYSEYNMDLLSFRTLWLIYYTAIFAITVSVVQKLYLRDRYTMIGSLLLNGVVIAAFLTVGLYELSVLRSSYLFDSDNQYFYRNGNIAVRYVGLVLMVPLLLANIWHLKNEFFTRVLRQTERILFHLTVLVLLSSELVHWLDMSLVENSFKLGLSILWGAYALFLIVLGLWKNQGYLRIAAIVLFGVTLVKLFLYDMADMSTISKTIVMIILGVLLLVASFLYNKNKRPAENEAQ